MLKRYDRTKLIQPSDWPNYVEKIRPIYEPEEIQTLLCHANDDEAIFLKFMVGSGFRDRETQSVTWRDIDFHNSVFRVTTKPIWGFKPKNWGERSVPLPTALIQQLSAVKERRNALPAQLLFPNSKGKPDSETDMIVKRVAERAKLNCGQCVTKHGNKCSEGPYCQHYFLHKFRHVRHRAPAARGRYSYSPDLDGAQGYQINHGLLERCPVEGCPGKDQRWSTGRICGVSCIRVRHFLSRITASTSRHLACTPSSSGLDARDIRLRFEVGQGRKTFRSRDLQHVLNIRA